MYLTTEPAEAQLFPLLPVWKPKLSGAPGERTAGTSPLILTAARWSETSLLVWSSQVTPLLELNQATRSKVSRWGRVGSGLGREDSYRGRRNLDSLVLLLVLSKCYSFLC